MLAAGALVNKIDITPTNGIYASSPDLAKCLSPIVKEVHDTITASDTIRDTVPVIKFKTKYKVRRIPCTHNDSTVSTLCHAREARKGTPPDTLPSNLKWYKVYGTIEPYNSENR